MLEILYGGITIPSCMHALWRHTSLIIYKSQVVTQPFIAKLLVSIWKKNAFSGSDKQVTWKCFSPQHLLPRCPWADPLRRRSAAFPHWSSVSWPPPKTAGRFWRWIAGKIIYSWGGFIKKIRAHKNPKGPDPNIYIVHYESLQTIINHHKPLSTTINRG